MAFSFRSVNFAEVIVAVDPKPAENDRMIQWARDYRLAFHPNSSSDEETAARATGSSGTTINRSSRILT